MDHRRILEPPRGARGKRRRPPLTPRQADRVAALRRNPSIFEDCLPWLTVRDAISDLPDPENNRRNGIPNHVFNPGARSYPGHTGSPYDEPRENL